MSQGGEGHSPFWCPNVFLEPIFGASISGAIARPNDWNTDSSPKAPVEAGGFKPCSHHPYMKKYYTINITSGKNWNIKLGQTNISLFAFEVMFEGIHNSVAPAVSLNVIFGVFSLKRTPQICWKIVLHCSTSYTSQK